MTASEWEFLEESIRLSLQVLGTMEHSRFLCHVRREEERGVDGVEEIRGEWRGWDRREMR